MNNQYSSNQDYKSSAASSSKKANKPSSFNKISTTDLDINQDVEKMVSEGSSVAAGAGKKMTDEASTISQKLISEVKTQGEAAWSQLQSLAKQYGVELSSARSLVARTTQQNPMAVVLGAACVGFCAGYLARGKSAKAE